jgi:hypothetical protein
MADGHSSATQTNFQLVGNAKLTTPHHQSKSRRHKFCIQYTICFPSFDDAPQKSAKLTTMSKAKQKVVSFVAGILFFQSLCVFPEIEAFAPGNCFTSARCRFRPRDNIDVRSCQVDETKLVHQSYQKFVKYPLDKSGGVLYRQSIFSNDELSAIKDEVAYFMSRLNEEKTSSVAHNRFGASLSPECETVRILREGSISKLVKKVAGSEMELSSQLPVEIRTYEKTGAGMAWHEDDVVYDPPQVEAVITLENSSDCQTLWKDPTGLIESKETDPNSVLLLKAGGPSHCVTSLKRGRRVILKCAYAANGSVFQEGVHKDQFGASKKNSKKRRKKR